MTPFTASASELIEMIAYERDALEFVRSSLFGQTESTSQTLNLNLSEGKNAEGFYRRDISVKVGPLVVGEQLVRSALSRLRPLAFSSTFKMHDLIVEWILRANGSTSWTFREKIADSERMRKGGTLSEPPVLASWHLGSQAFWALYKSLTPFRNEVVHGGGFSLAESRLDILHRGRKLSLSNEEQAAYVRAICLIADAAMRNGAVEILDVYRIEHDFHTLCKVHGVAGLKPRPLRIASVQVAAQGFAAADGRISANINFDDIKREAERTFPTEGEILAYDLTVRAEDGSRRVGWHFPPLAAPTGERRVAEGDPEFEPYVTVG